MPSFRLRLRLSSLSAGLFVVALVTASLGLPASAADPGDPRLRDARAHREAVQRQLGELLQRIDTLEAETSETEVELDRLTEAQAAEASEAAAAGDTLAEQVREAYKRAGTDPTMAMLASGSPQEAADTARLLGLLSRRNRATMETALATQLRTAATAELVADAVAELDRQQAELDATRTEVTAVLDDAQQQEDQVLVTMAAEEQERQAAAQREARERTERASRSGSAPRSEQTATTTAATTTTADEDPDQVDDEDDEDDEPPATTGGGDAAGAPAASSGAIACPVGNPRNYSDTYGAPRSGGRRHQGVDILAPHGTPIYAYENGTINRMNGNRLGGISLYLQGASGTVYYYTHLAGYVSGLAPGQAVSVGQHIAFNGDTGNAAGIPHLHFEVMPGGGGGVNPYPYARRACG